MHVYGAGYRFMEFDKARQDRVPRTVTFPIYPLDICARPSPAFHTPSTPSIRRHHADWWLDLLRIPHGFWPWPEQRRDELEQVAVFVKARGEV